MAQVTDHLVRELQERAARAIPARVVEVHDGDWWRLAESDAAWWAGSALLHGTGDLSPRIQAVEEFCAANGTTARFQVCTACTPGLDDELERRGYRRDVEVSLQVAETSVVAAHGPGLTVELEAGVTGARAMALLDGAPVAVGRAVAEDGWTGVFDMATAHEARRRGAGRAVLAGLARWATAHGCDRMYLQVARDNVAAVALYRHCGFTELAAYHYRVAPAG